MLFGAIAPLLGFALPSSLGPVVSDGALTLLLLTILVTPANLYALTHGANFPLDVRTSMHLPGAVSPRAPSDPGVA